MTTNTQHPLSGLHINQGSIDAAADAYEGEYLRAKIQTALDRMERVAAGHAIGADKADDRNGYQGGFGAGFLSCLNGFREALK
ncbi:hypothetical protein ABRZ04_04260 [Castellaniella ginsengisoli]|uniref:Uncharacterized protein n=1 Tax=Castellaniella ginsengisoli TaxID=546114 RepID=A0AB39D0W0_9BURK